MKHLNLHFLSDHFDPIDFINPTHLAIPFIATITRLYLGSWAVQQEANSKNYAR